MGALHAGHMSLVEAARSECDVVAASIFVNPTQFGPEEDLEDYPRTLEDDLSQLREAGVRLVFTPEQSAMYPTGYATAVEMAGVADRWEGECRPGHFAGVATVVTKLLHVLPADVAYFGQKDYQQSLVIRRLVTDLNIPIDIRTCPIVREQDGLALSSRNAYLSTEQRERALGLSRSLQLAEQLIAGGAVDARLIRDRMRQELQRTAVDQIDYIAIVDPDRLEPG